jgi:hypothetical protein
LDAYLPSILTPWLIVPFWVVSPNFIRSLKVPLFEFIKAVLGGEDDYYYYFWSLLILILFLLVADVSGFKSSLDRSSADY